MLKFNRKRMAILVVLALIIGILAFQLWYNEYNKPKDYKRIYNYTVSIRPNSTEQFLIVCSIPLHDTGTVPAHLMEEIYVEGNVTIDITETIHGLGLRVRGNGPVLIRWEKIYRSENGPYIRLSMIEINRTSNSGTAWFYSNVSNLCINTFFNYSYSSLSDSIRYGSWGYYEAQDWLSSGWNEADVKLEFRFT